jgi:transposase, IS30 family
MTVSHQTIYRTLFIQARGAFRKVLTQYLRTQRGLRRSAQARAPGRGQIPHPVTITEHPASIEDRAIPRHWEGGLLLSAGIRRKSSPWSSARHVSSNCCASRVAIR